MSIEGEQVFGVRDVPGSSVSTLFAVVEMNVGDIIDDEAVTEEIEVSSLPCEPPV